MRQDFEALLTDLDHIESRAVRVQIALNQTAIKASDVQQSISISLSSVENQAQSAFAVVGAQASGAIDVVASASSSITTAAEAASAAVASSTAKIADATHTAANKMDDLVQLVADRSNLWGAGIANLIEAIKIGAAPVDDLFRLFGGTMVEGQRLEQFLGGSAAQWAFYGREVTKLANQLNQGAVDISKVLDFLSQTQLTFAKQLVDIIKLFEQGKVTLETVEKTVAEAKKTFPGTEFADLAGALYAALLKGKL
jgi:hypothetical protein